MRKHEHPSLHLAMKDAAESNWVADTAGDIETMGIVTAGRCVHIKRQCASLSSYVMQLGIAVRESDAVAGTNRYSFGSEPKVLLVDMRERRCSGRHSLQSLAAQCYYC